MLRVVLFWCSIGFLASMAHVTFTNLKCSLTNESVGEFKECRIKAVNRTHKYITIYAKLNMKPLNDLRVNFKLLRYNYGYKPFFFDITFDACKFLKNRNNVVANLFYETFSNYSNMNHTCPYDHDIIVDKLWTGNQEVNFEKFIPFPNGDYIFSFITYEYKMHISTVEVYIRKN